MTKFPPRKILVNLYSPARLLVCAVLLLLAFLSVARAQNSPSQTQLEIDPNNAAMRRITDQLMCQCGGCNATVLRCPHELDCSSRGYILNTIQRGIDAGKSDQVIIASIAKEYGPRILAEPPHQGFTLLGWLMPFAALLLGGGAVSYVLWQWNAEEPQPVPSDGGTAGLALPASAARPELIEKYRSQIDRELEKY